MEWSTFQLGKNAAMPSWTTATTSYSAHRILYLLSRDNELSTYRVEVVSCDSGAGFQKWLDWTFLFFFEEMGPTDSYSWRVLGFDLFVKGSFYVKIIETKQKKWRWYLYCNAIATFLRSTTKAKRTLVSFGVLWALVFLSNPFFPGHEKCSIHLFSFFPYFIG